MIKQLLSAVLLCACAATGTANAAVLTFDDIPGVAPASYGAIGSYAGYTFGSTGDTSRLDWVDTAGELYGRGAVSGSFTMVNNFGGAAVIRRDGGADFSFGGLWAENWLDWDTAQGSLQGYRDGSLVWTSDMTLGASFAYHAGVAGNIDELRIDFNGNFIVDNLELNDAAAEVPVPGTEALMALGLAGLFLRRKKR